MGARFLCPNCGMPVDAQTEVDRTTEPITLAVTLTLDGHDCNPRLLALFEPDSQHAPPFER